MFTKNKKFSTKIKLLPKKKNSRINFQAKIKILPKNNSPKVVPKIKSSTRNQNF